MPGALLPERPPPVTTGAVRPAPVSGKLVVFVVLAIGVTVVLGVGTFAALTRPPKSATHPAPSSSVAVPPALIF